MTAARLEVRPARRARARRPGITVYAVVVAALVLPANLIAAAGGADAALGGKAPVGAQIALFAQAVIPAAAALIAWAVARRRPTWGFRRAGVRVLASAWAIGVCAVGLGYAAIWTTGAGRFSAAGIETAFGGIPLPLAVVAGLVPGVLPWLLLAVGEELGWNSFLTPLLAGRFRTDRVALIVGAGWAAFHLPLMLLVPGAVAAGVPTGWAVANFTVECLALAFPLVWLRVRTGSIWPALVLHGTVNAAIYLVGQPGTVAASGSGWWIGEGGLLTTVGVVVGVVVTAPLWRRR